MKKAFFLLLFWAGAGIFFYFLPKITPSMAITGCGRYAGHSCQFPTSCLAPKQMKAPNLEYFCVPGLVCCFDPSDVSFSGGGTACKTGDGKDGVLTAIGCVPEEPSELIKKFFPFLLGLGGVVAFSLIVFSGIQILTSGGNPEKIQGAKETITSAITGLLFIILSLFLLRLIGVDFLGLPGLE